MTLSWLQIMRRGLVQMALGAIVVLITLTLNRLIVVEFALPALLSGLLVRLRYGIQLSRPRWGFTSDTGGNRTLWIIGGRSENRVVPHVSDGGVPRLCRRISPYRDDRICDDGSDADTAGRRPWLL